MRFGINDMIDFFSSDPDVTVITDDGDGRPKDRTLEALKDKVQNAKDFKNKAWKHYQQAEKDLSYALRELDVYEAHSSFDEK